MGSARLMWVAAAVVAAVAAMAAPQADLEAERQAAVTFPLYINFRGTVTGFEPPNTIAESGFRYQFRQMGLQYGFINATGDPMSFPGNTQTVPESASQEAFVQRTSYKFTDKLEQWRITFPGGRRALRVRVYMGNVNAPVQGMRLIIRDEIIVDNVNQQPGRPFYVWTGDVATNKKGEVEFRGGIGTPIQFIEFTDYGTCIPQPSVFQNQESISYLQCSDVQKNDLPWSAPFGNSTAQALKNRGGKGIGFTMVMPSTNLEEWWFPEQISVVGDMLVVRPFAYGSWNNGINNVVNAMGVGIPQPDMSVQVQAQIGIPSGPFSTRPAAACMYTALSDRIFTTLCVYSTTSGHRIEMRSENEDELLSVVQRAIQLPASRVLTLIIELVPATDTVITRFKPEDGAEQSVGRISPHTPLLFSKDGATVSFKVGTATMAGLYFSGTRDLKYEVRDFIVREIDTQPVEELGEEDFNIDFSFGVGRFPTALTVCPDGKLYVVSAEGNLNIVTLDRNERRVISKRVLQPVGPRLLLGVECDPNSTADTTALWLSSTDIEQEGGTANSGIVHKVSGTDFQFRRDVITGLPRSFANHANYQLHFGPDKWLYIGVGSNTGAGATNYLPSDFSYRPEQALSAAMLRFNVLASNFSGQCQTDSNVTALDGQKQATKLSALGADFFQRCQVDIYATGLRSPYDFVFLEKNNWMYITDNGVGGDSAFPWMGPDFTDRSLCPLEVSAVQFVNVASGRVPDYLMLAKPDQPGRFYGHPNPARDECIFQGGNPTADFDYPVPRSKSAGGGRVYMEHQKYPVGVQPEPNFTPATFSFGLSLSPNGIIEYLGNAFCGYLREDLLVAYYSQMDRIQVLELTDDKTTVKSDRPLRRSSEKAGGRRLKNPLALAQDPTGVIYVGEFFAGRVSYFDPIGPDCWLTGQALPRSLPSPRTRAASTRIGDNVYMYGGKGPTGFLYGMMRYNSIRNGWKQLAAFNGRQPVMNPVMVAYKGKLWIFGGLHSDGSASNLAISYNIATDTYQYEPKLKLPEASGGSIGFLAGKRAVLVGGINSNGTVVGTTIRANLDQDTFNLFRVSTPMTIPRRDHAGVLVGDFFYVCGGRNASGQPLANCEVLHMSELTWRFIAPMPEVKWGHSGAKVAKAKIVFSGGFDANGLSTSTFSYNIITNKWIKLSPAPVARTGATVERLGSSVLAIGGTTTGGRILAGVSALSYL